MKLILNYLEEALSKSQMQNLFHKLVSEIEATLSIKNCGEEISISTDPTEIFDAMTLVKEFKYIENQKEKSGQ